MIKEYSISDILPHSGSSRSFYIRHFESEEDVEIEWPHCHSFFSFVWFTHGSGLYVIDSEEYEIKPQRVFYVAPKQIHNWSFYDDAQGYIIVIDQFVSLEMNINHAYPYIDIDNSDIPLHISIIENCLKELGQNDKLSDENIKIGLLYYARLLNRIAIDKNIRTYEGNIIVERFKSLILADSFQLHTIPYYAGKMNIRQSKLDNICKKVFGISAKQYVLNLKITEAKRLLIYSDMNIDEIAFRIGFEDSSYFSRVFKKKTNLSPSLFLKKYRKLS